MTNLKIFTIFSLFLLNACGSSNNSTKSATLVTPSTSEETTRTEASYEYLHTNNNHAFSTSAYIPNNGVTATNIFEGTLTIKGSPTFKKIYGAAKDLPLGYQQWPEFSYQFIQDNGRLIPVDRSHGFIGTGAWSITAGVGAVWNEASDNGYSRAAFPYTIKEANQNCEANGLATFLFKNDGSISNVQIQNVAETCKIYGFEFYGTLTAEYNHHHIAAKSQVIADRNQEEAGFIPTKPLSDLAVDFPGVDLTKYPYVINDEELNGYSILINPRSV